MILTYTTLGLGAVDLFIDDANPFNKAVHSSLGIILTSNGRFDNILFSKMSTLHFVIL